MKFSQNIDGDRHLDGHKYRSDIDGLRAIAVLSVVFYHAAPTEVKGGFVGVDIFFVISGYLISTIILENLRKSAFSFIDFYSRRIRRIFPALLLVLIASYVFGWFSLLDYEYAQLGEHIAGGAGFISNLLLLNEISYFNTASDTKPFLHLWSLGVEEQFYIFWPVILWMIWRTRLNSFVFTVLIASASFVLNIEQASAGATNVFFSPQTRIWELLAGASLAHLTKQSPGLLRSMRNCFNFPLKNNCTKEKQEVIWKSVCNAQSIAGFLLIIISISFIKKEYAFPGWWGALPVAGAVLLVGAGEQAWVNRKLLSSRVLVWFGLISYPLYLWHWPLLSFARILEGQTPPAAITLTAVIISIILARLTYRFIETPVRIGGRYTEKTLILALLMTIVGTVGYGTYRMKGLEFRTAAKPAAINKGEVGHEAYYNYLSDNFSTCTTLTKGECYQSKKNQPIKLILIGDSHALHLLVGLAGEINTANIAFYGKSVALNDKSLDEILNQVIADDEIRSVIFNNWWYLRASETPANSNLSVEIERIVGRLVRSNKHVYLTDDIPSFDFDPEKCQLSRKLSFSGYRCQEEKEAVEIKYRTYNKALEVVARKYPQVQIIRTTKYLCDDHFCSMNRDNQLLYRDRHHLNLNGSRYIAKRIIEDYPQLQSIDD